MFKVKYPLQPDTDKFDKLINPIFGKKLSTMWHKSPTGKSCIYIANANYIDFVKDKIIADKELYDEYIEDEEFDNAGIITKKTMVLDEIYKMLDIEFTPEDLYEKNEKYINFLDYLDKIEAEEKGTEYVNHTYDALRNINLIDPVDFLHRARKEYNEASSALNDELIDRLSEDYKWFSRTYQFFPIDIHDFRELETSIRTNCEAIFEIDNKTEIACMRKDGRWDLFILTDEFFNDVITNKIKLDKYVLISKYWKRTK